MQNSAFKMIIPLTGLLLVIAFQSGTTVTSGPSVPIQDKLARSSGSERATNRQPSSFGEAVVVIQPQVAPQAAARLKKRALKKD